MSWSKALRASLLTGMLLGTGAFLGACSFSPVYSGTLASQPSLNLAYAKPTTRLEQIVYQELSFRLGESTAETAPLASVTVSSSAGDMMATATANPAKAVRVTVTAKLTITPRDGKDATPMVFSRTATAQYTRNGQVLADNAAADEAAERAARSAAESLRLAVLASLSRT
ncbi:LPS assembly lipoprotein LptE [Devosia aquimaris]|uniref:LPS assembly lipoprotein LptE n=1 Tax=Devosia aquimaris TaxID=2866214 RepID=UPI001CD0DD66|nr:LPS assembly lipoprotein LptE [Devosia sp. CJK-A8-3]